MTRKEFLQRYFPRFAASLAILAILVYTVYHVAGSSKGGLMTVPVRHIDDKQILGGTAYLFREENLLTVENEGLILDLAESGTKVSKDVPLAQVYATDLDGQALAAAQLQLDALNRSITVLESSQLPPGSTLQQAAGYRQAATQASLSIRQAIAEGRWDTLAALEDEMLIALNRYAALTGEREDLQEALDALKQERTALLSGLCTTVRNTRSSGYYYDRHSVDGYESVFTPWALTDLTPEAFDALIASSPTEPDGFAVGKTINGYDWYLALRVEADGLSMLEVGGIYAFTFPENGNLTMSLTCHRIVEGENGGLLIFHSNQIPPEFDFLRSQTVEITVGTCSGYYIPDTALHTVNGVEGVYIFQESTVRFRKIQILYRGEGYCIARADGEGEDALSLNDVLITSGKNLYDGKVY
ncbi:MAG: hypothetical protein IJX62_03725 [Clostridia bacterium]|nr:hypothetical protein [Clostridia bacterium]